MDESKRKRVTRVGSGAYSVYLPKKWIEAWPPEQQIDRAIDLHHIGHSILVVPVLEERRFDASLPDQRAEVEDSLVSAYVRGCNTVVLTADSSFSNDVITAARQLLRHLDERIVATVSKDEIGYTLDPSRPPPFTSGADILALMVAKLREVLALAAEAVDAHTDDPERAIHCIQLCHAVHREDVGRLLHQTLRMVATVELPIATVTDFQLLDLLAAAFFGASSQAIRVANAVLSDLGIPRDQLDHPRELLLAKVQAETPSPLARAILRTYRKPFDGMKEILPKLQDAIAKADMKALRAHVESLDLAAEALQARVLEQVAMHWGTSTDGRSFAAYRMMHPVLEILATLARACRHAITLRAAEK